MKTTDRSCVIRLTKARVGIPGPAGERSVLVLQRGTLDVKLSVPVPPNQQTPHAQDEIYVIIRGELAEAPVSDARVPPNNRMQPTSQSSLRSRWLAPDAHR